MPEAQVNPNMVILARESRGYQQKELASLLHVTQGKISKVESGFLSVSSGFLAELSHVLHYPEQFFSQNADIYPLGLNFYRKNKGIDQRTIRRIEAFVNIRRTEIESLLRSVSIEHPKIVPVWDPEEDRFGSPEKVAAALRQEWRIQKGPITNLTTVLEDACIIIIPCSFGTRYFSGLSTITNLGSHIIFVNGDMPGDRLRFTLAHELGHIIMHRTLTDAMEEQADRFASEFLMPANEIRSQLTRITIDRLPALKLYWKVSMGALITRAHTLHQIDDGHQRLLWMQMSKYGYRLNEPIEYGIPKESPTLLTSTLASHLGELGYSIEQVTALLNLHEDEFRSLYLTKEKEVTPRLRLLSSLKEKKGSDNEK